MNSPIDDSAHFDYLDPHHLFEAFAGATAGYWRRRAAGFEAARPRPGDFTGRSTPEEICARDKRLADLATACRNRAEAAERYGLTPTEKASFVDVATAIVVAA